jgi:hypothetical protein
MENLVNMEKIIELIVGFSFITSVLYFLDSYVLRKNNTENELLGKLLSLCFILIISGVVCNLLIFNDSNVDNAIMSRLVSLICFVFSILLGYYIGKNSSNDK